MTETELNLVFIEYGVYALAKAIEDGSDVDPKVYETVYKYLDKKELDTIPEPESGTAAADQLAKIRAKHGMSEEE